ncbi:hypothetical protein [Aestuariicoccus sp. MJ-SS9]|uniref:hypothetical protein n=1 Tax=Aestuariicoccus sp. MJ-SS9 TaxID=3079855 RepID=UPI00290CBBC2|nr:hypothetical protein [Aestuariicoccus sp. MJ-SS9]MDU8911498.1 hypothetical protein [Aestuariicoccus sp. MJ-SS9]
MRTVLNTLILCLAAPFAAAQEFDDRWAVVGTFDVTVEGEAITLYALDDLEKSRDFIDITRMNPFTVYAVSGAALGDDGQPARPYVTVMIGPFSSSPGPEADVEWRADGKAYFANIDSGTTGSLNDFALTDDGALSFSFSADTLIEMKTDADWNYVPVEGSAPIAVSGRFQGRLIEEE